jgi:outer membrane cobalamin receptor
VRFHAPLHWKNQGVVCCKTSGISGSATNIIIRGYTSITGSNQPLFIVDGVPLAAIQMLLETLQMAIQDRVGFGP